MSTHARPEQGRQAQTRRPGQRRRGRGEAPTTVTISSVPPRLRPGYARHGAANGPASEAYDVRLRIRIALSRLPEARDRAIVVMRFFLGLTLAQIAERLPMDIDDVRERYRLSIRRMERDLELR